MIDIIIPIQSGSEQLDKTLLLLDKYKNDIANTVHILECPDLNVSEARQLVLDDDKYGPYICYLDDDSEMIMDHWLDKMYDLLISSEKIGIVFGGEWWGIMDPPKIEIVEGGRLIEFMETRTPAACMLLDKRRLDKNCKWDQYIGLRNGWLGGDFEEIDFSQRVRQSGLELRQATDVIFHHTGGKTDSFAFSRTDRVKCICVMGTLIGNKYMTPDTEYDDEYFKSLNYAKADPNDDCMLAAGESLRECYVDIIQAHFHLRNIEILKRIIL